MMKKAAAWPENLNVEMNTILFQEAPQGKRWDSRSGTPGAKQHSNPAKQQRDAKSKQTIYKTITQNISHMATILFLI